MTATTSSPPSTVDPTKDPTAPAINSKVIAAAGAVGLPGLGLAITNYAQNGHISVPAIVLAIAGLAGGLAHSNDVGRRFQTWLQTEPGRLAAAHPELAALRAEAVQLRADLSKTAGDTKKALDTAAEAASTATGIDLHTPLVDLESRMAGSLEDTKADLEAGTTHAANLVNQLADRVAAIETAQSPPPLAGQTAPASDVPPGAPDSGSTVDPAVAAAQQAVEAAQLALAAAQAGLPAPGDAAGTPAAAA